MPQDFSVVMSVYHADHPVHFAQAIESVINQSLQPIELILVVDGPINGKLKDVVYKYEGNPLVKLMQLPDNVGLGSARHQAILSAVTPVVAVMDSDDICLPNRFELQIEALNTKKIDVVGAYIAEFSEFPEALERVRKVPLIHDQIVKRGRLLSPINHVTIMFRKESYLRVGGYHAFRKVEDYDLFYRMVVAGLKFANLPEILVLVRATDAQYTRRHGLEYLREEIKLCRGMFKSGYIGYIDLLRNLAIRIVVRLMPVSILEILSKRFLRVSSIK